MIDTASALSRTVLAAALCAAPLCAHVHLLAPNGGEILRAGAVTVIRWEVSVQHDTQNWDLWYSVSGANGPWLPIAMDLPPGNISRGARHEYRWTVPATASTQVRVRVRQDNSGLDYEDISDSDLTITVPAGSYTPFGAGCSGSAGVPSLQAAPGSLPAYGQEFRASLGNLPPASTGAAVVLGAARIAPFDLRPLGMPGCVLEVGIDALFPVAPQGGAAQWQVVIPDDARLLGAGFYNQALVLDAAAGNRAGAVISNAAHGVIG